MSEPRWTRRIVVSASVFVTLALLQVIIPIHAMFQPRPARFGWQMYSTVSHAPDVWIEDASGTRHPVDVLSYMGDPRAEIVWGRPLAAALCGDEAVQAVVVVERGVEERIPCS